MIFSAVMLDNVSILEVTVTENASVGLDFGICSHALLEVVCWWWW